jgi:hypothetical protein
MRRTAPKATLCVAAAFSGLAAANSALAAPQMAVTVDLPALKVAEYHRPYVAMWIEGADQQPVKTLAVWYNVSKPNDAGAKWLKDMRTWWRKAGREMTSLGDGVSGPSRAAGKHVATFAAGGAPLGQLAPGKYTLVTEVARETGGREVVKAPFSWPPTAAVNTAVKGTGAELSGVALALKP